MDTKEYLQNSKVVKKDGNLQAYDFNKIIIAINKSATRVNYSFTKFELNEIKSIIESILTEYILENDTKEIPIMVMHSTVEKALTKVVPEVANSYKEYRNYKVDFIRMLDKAYTEAQRIQYHGDKENSNSDSTLVSTKRCLTFGIFNKELYKKFFLTKEEIQAIKDGACIVTDTQMAKAGINKRALARYGGEVYCFMSDEDVAKIAKENGSTRATASMDKAAEMDKKLIFAIGNAPTALVRLYELIEEKKLDPELIIGVPVGFVNVVQSKELIMHTDVPYIVARGRKGGSNIAACICNALLYMIDNNRG